MSRRLRTHTGSRLTLTALKNNMDASGDVIGRVKIGVVALAGAKRALAVVALIALYLPRVSEAWRDVPWAYTATQRSPTSTALLPMHATS